MDAYEIAKSLIRSALLAGNSLSGATTEAIRLVQNAGEVNRAAADVGRELKIIEDLRPAPICDDNRARWYTGSTPDARYWPAYRDKLTASGWIPSMVETLDKTTNWVVGLLGAPGNKTIDTRGLVVGRVQSGKTAHFTGVIAKAADCNYRFFIILSGITNSLRLQTQKRIERDLTQPLPGAWTWLTKREIYGDFGDFPPGNVDVALRNRSGRTIGVVKKNSQVLRRIIDWIRGGNELLKQECPVLVVDDEADQASINTAKTMDQEELTAINKRIVDLLASLPKCAYVGYTATPFANVLTDPDYEKNLYPRSFIYSLPTPTDYFGAEKIFGRDRLNPSEPDEVTDGLNLIRTVELDELKYLRPRTRADVDTFEFGITSSLENALRYFFLATAARLFREEKSGIQMDFSTMLIHTSERVRVHELTKKAVAGFKLSALESIRSNDLKAWEQQWQDEMASIDREKLGVEVAEVKFKDLLPFLHRAADRCKLIVSNSDPNQETNVSFEEKGQIAIIMGGNTLSRGLTLEGLVVSYFVRSSNAYDTILQMGRWFGYRRGYEDLPRIWMTPEMQDHFFDLATIEQEFRTGIERYTLGSTPLEVAPRIRKHPKMRITAPNKMRFAITCQTSYGGERLQTIYFKRLDKGWLSDNLKACEGLLRAISSKRSPDVDHRQVFREVPAGQVLSFLKTYSFHERSRDLNSGLITDYIFKQNGLGALTNWNVVIAGRRTKDKDLGSMDLGIGTEINLINRSRLSIGDESTANIKALMSPSDILADQEIGDRKNLEAKTAEELFGMRKDKRSGLLVLYPISPASRPDPARKGAVSRTVLGAVAPVMGIALVFPTPAGNRPDNDYVSADVKPVVSSEASEDEDV